MKKIIVLSALAAIITTASYSQETKEPQKDMKKEAAKKDYAEWEKKIKTELQLTEEQTAKFDALNKEYKEKIDVIVKDTKLSKEDQKEKKMALKKEKESKFLEILTPEQQIKYNAVNEKMKKENETVTKQEKH